MAVCEKSIIKLLIGSIIKMSDWETWCTNSSLGCFIEDRKFIASDKVSCLFFLQNGLCWLVGWLVYPNADYCIYMASFNVVVMIYGPPEYFLKDLDIFSSTLSTKEDLVNVQKIVTTSSAVTHLRSLFYWVHLLPLLESHHDGISWVDQECHFYGDSIRN